MQELRLTIPTKASEFRIKHFKAFSNPALITTELDRMYLLSLLLGVSINVVRQQSPKDIDKWLGIYENALMQMDMTAEPPKEITINGKEYSRVDPKKVGYGWHMDFRQCNINDDPTRLACLFYFPKGQIYGAVDEHDVLISPIRDRYEDFKEHFPLDVFIQATGFFELIREINENLYGKKDSGTKDEKPIPKAPKWQDEETIDQVAQHFFQGNWKRVTDLNIYKYKYYCDFLTFKNKKAEAQARKLRRRK